MRMSKSMRIFVLANANIRYSTTTYPTVNAKSLACDAANEHAPRKKAQDAPMAMILCLAGIVGRVLTR